MQVLSAEQSETLLQSLDLQTSIKDDWGLAIVQGALTKKNWKRLRNVTAYLLMLDAGLRVGEVIRLSWPNVYFANAPVQTLELPAQAAKRHQPRSIPLSVRLQQAILRLYNNTSPPYTLPRLDNLITYSQDSQSITTRTIERIIESASLKSLGFQVHPHMLRHTFATRLMKITNMPTVQALLGHKHLSSTQRYTHPNSDDKRNAIDQLSGTLPAPGLGGDL